MSLKKTVARVKLVVTSTNLINLKKNVIKISFQSKYIKFVLYIQIEFISFKIENNQKYISRILMYRNN